MISRHHLPEHLVAFEEQLNDDEKFRLQQRLDAKLQEITEDISSKYIQKKQLLDQQVCLTFLVFHGLFSAEQLP